MVSSPAVGDPHLETLRKHASTQLGLVTRAQALAAGLSPQTIVRRLNAGDLEWVRRRVYRLDASTPISVHQRLLATCLSLGKGTVASHDTAAWLWDLDGFRDPPKPLDLTTAHGKHVTLDGFRIHQRRKEAAEGYTIRHGVPVTILARTLLDLAPQLTDAQLEVTLDAAGRYRFGYFHDVAEFLGNFQGKKGQGHAGIDRLHQLVQLRRGNEATGSVVETAVLQVLRKAGIEAPFTQYPIFRYPDRPLCLADFAWPRLKIALFSDSNYHLGKRARLDANQRLELIKLGWRPAVVFKKMLDDRKWISSFAELFHPVIP